jgi:apolipoprotein N-acyltransferase
VTMVESAERSRWGTRLRHAPAEAARRPVPARSLTRLSRPLTAAAAGAALLLSFPPYGWWWSAAIGVALLTLAVAGTRCLPGAGLGGLCGLVLFVPMLFWTGLHVGFTPWLLLAGLQAGYLALLGAAGSWLWPLSRRWPWCTPVASGVLWTGQEALRDRTPFGGFPWGRLAFSQADGPALALARLGGAPLVTFAVAVAGGLMACSVLAAAGEWRRRRVPATGTWRPATTRWAVTARWPVTAAAPAVGAVAVALLGLTVPAARPAGPPVTVAIVQGNVPRLGLDFNAQRRAVLDNHVEATLALAATVAAGAARQPDLVVWPENASDIDPLANADAAQRITEAAHAIRAPILVGAVLEGPGDNIRNAALVWLPGSGADQTYVKRHPVPFAEYVPLRRLARLVSEQVDRVGSDFVAGDRPGVLRVGPATVGDVICFEVAYDDVVRDTVTGGAQLLVVQTNNATFNPAEARQQLAMVRLRAVEHGRYALMASTVGISGFVRPDGTVAAATGFNTQAVKVGELRLSTARTLASRVGAGPEYVLTGAAVVMLLLAAWWRARLRSARADGRTDGRTDGRSEATA